MAKSILITGSTDGIGKLAAIRLAKDGHQVYLHGRSKEKLKAVIAEVQRESGNENIKGFVADLSDLTAVAKLATEIKAEMESLDVLINNAGVYKSSVATNDQGLDLRFGVNYLAPVLLTESLLPLLKVGDSPRVVNLSSAAQAPVSLQALAGAASLGHSESYAQSKLALTMWSFDLASQEKEVNIIAVNPGSLLNTRMVREGFNQVWSSADKGSDILYELAVSPAHADKSGLYFNNDLGDPKGDYGPAHGEAYNATSIKELIALTQKMLEEYK